MHSLDHCDNKICIHGSICIQDIYAIKIPCRYCEPQPIVILNPSQLVFFGWQRVDYSGDCVTNGPAHQRDIKRKSKEKKKEYDKENKSPNKKWRKLNQNSKQTRKNPLNTNQNNDINIDIDMGIDMDMNTDGNIDLNANNIKHL